MYYYLYKITNLINQKYYIGAHQTDNLDDGYMGSGIDIKEAYKKYGKSNFRKEILQFCDSADELFTLERTVVNEDFVKNPMTYNIKPGGRGGSFDWSSESRDKISRQNKNKVVARNLNTGKFEKISKEEFNSNENYVGTMKGQKSNHTTAGYAVMKDKDNNIMFVSVTDPRKISGELVGVTAGSSQTDESNKKRSDTLKGRKPANALKEIVCPYCGKCMNLGNFTRWHKDGRCKNKIQSNLHGNMQEGKIKSLPHE